MRPLLALLISAQVLALVSGCAWHTVKVTTNVFQLPKHTQNANVDTTTMDDQVLVEQDASSVFEAPQSNKGGNNDLDKGVGIYVHANGRTLAVAGPVDLAITCRNFGKDSNVAVIWGGMTYVCEGGELSTNAKNLLGELSQGVAAAFTGNPGSMVGPMLPPGVPSTPALEQ